MSPKTSVLTSAVDFPANEFSNLKISKPSNNPWQPALDASRPSTSHSQGHTIQEQDSGKEVWSSPPTRQAPQAPAVSSHELNLIDFEDNASPAWDEDDYSEAENDDGGKLTPAHESPPVFQQDPEAQQGWSEDVGHSPPNQAALGPKTTLDGGRRDQTQASASRKNHEVSQLKPSQSEGWDLVDHEYVHNQAQQSGTIDSAGRILHSHNDTEGIPPPLPPRNSEEQPPPQPPRPTDHNDQAIASTGAAAQKQRGETYEIKKIHWHDANTSQNPRVSPILVQNANGPCPLLALVNALTLSTPADINTALVETLRSREQVSLGLLLDAVFDELMSGRRGDAAQDLPDVSDLYVFLLTLHTGMNVNPRFVPSTEVDQFGAAFTDGEESSPGTFEETREMKLYSTFSIPLIHGWIAGRTSSAYRAMSRSARSYEDAQNLMFHEESLEEKLQNEGLSFEEQALLEDISTIKAFLLTAATQLTPHGLRTITSSIPPGTVAILFRNDHFSTLYRHPRTLQLMQLVTDMGYAGHDEVVWESLIDVNGERAEFFSGDFHVVGGASSSSNSRRRRGNSDQSSSTGGRRPTSPPMSPNNEQEDHDLALALQLQEEEEERHRSDQAARRREAELSQQYIEQQGGPGGASIPVSQRTSSRNTTGTPTSRTQHRVARRGSSTHEVRPLIPPRRNGPVTTPADPEAGVDAPPPSYEHAATQDPYVPPVNHPAHPSASADQAARRTSAYTANSSSGSGPTFSSIHAASGATPGRGRRQTLIDQIRERQGVEGEHQRDREKECVVM